MYSVVGTSPDIIIAEYVFGGHLWWSLRNCSLVFMLSPIPDFRLRFTVVEIRSIGAEFLVGGVWVDLLFVRGCKDHEYRSVSIPSAAVKCTHV